MHLTKHTTGAILLNNSQREVAFTLPPCSELLDQVLHVDSAFVVDDELPQLPELEATDPDVVYQHGFLVFLLQHPTAIVQEHHDREAAVEGFVVEREQMYHAGPIAVDPALELLHLGLPVVAGEVCAYLCCSLAVEVAERAVFLSLNAVDANLFHDSSFGLDLQRAV